MSKTAFIVRDKNGAYQKPRPFAEEQHPLFRPAQTRFRLVDGLLILLVLAIFLGLVLLLSK